MPAHRFGIANQKGGVAKTTTVVNLATNLASRGYRVLLVDYDPQGNATTSLGRADLTETEGVFTSAELTIAQAELLRGRKVFDFNPVRDVLHLSDKAGGCLDLVPATDDLAYMENDLVIAQDITNTSRYLRFALDAIHEQYDFIFVDSGPTLGMLMLNVLVATRNIIVPVKLSPLSVSGALRLRKHIEERLVHSVDPSLRIFGVLGTFMKHSSNKPREVLAVLKTIFGDRVFDVVINDNQATDDATESGEPVILKDPAARGAIQYDLLTDELLARLGHTNPALRMIP